jgi:two-component system, LytTR family, sensor kinase
MPARVFVTSFVAWAVVGVFNVAPAIVARISSGAALPTVMIALIAQSMVVWALYTPLILWLCLRFPLARTRRTLAIHATCAGLLAVLDPLIDTPMVWLVEVVPEPYTQRFLEELFINAFAYVAVAGIGYALAYRRGLADQRAYDARLEAQLLRAQLDALVARLQPHFLFNSLHSVTSLIRTGERDEAVRAVVGLSELLRGTLASDGSALSSLGGELAWIRRYVQLEQLRFQDRLEVQVADASELATALVPTLVLQPLVENAFRHGVEARVGASRVEVSVRREADRLILEVTDSGDAHANTLVVDRSGLGLSATRARLAHLFGADGRLELEVSPGHSRATIDIPFRAGVAP